MVKISSFIIAMILVAGIVTILTLGINEISTNYDVTLDNESQAILNKFNKSQELIEDAQDIQDSATTIGTETGITDIIGSYFKNGYKVLKVATGSLSVFWTMTDASSTAIGTTTGASTKYLMAMIIAIVIIAIFVGVLASAILKKDI
jgi:archaellum component FlaG (FlaF/FlaG flagellin family)